MDQHTSFAEALRESGRAARRAVSIAREIFSPAMSIPVAVARRVVVTDRFADVPPANAPFPFKEKRQCASWSSSKPPPIPNPAKCPTPNSWPKWAASMKNS
ncbi:hypothetical protein KDX20_03185 [Burkholderia cenocepacia]|uniref:hypothetical protein n=1 Tax=Burkholderia cenocepacia TaxID=95486 RepID=UPI001B9BDBDB|nr:hypothetical protein [Burkholderia cenocepacia]MBR8153451.1 hypothetical protein [Burkholderia cenocepacia]MCA8083120.1 hypothetical protein [Burkholderia cenocepacia]HEB3533371.1 hypothetical protein [Burkholderia cenocepacia]